MKKSQVRRRKVSSGSHKKTDLDLPVLEAVVNKGVKWAKPSDLGDHVLELGEHQFAFNIVGQNAVNIYFHVNGVGQRDDYKVDKKTGVVSVVKRIPKSLQSVATETWLPLLICFLLVTAVFVIYRMSTGQSFGAVDVAEFWNVIWYSTLGEKPAPWYIRLSNYVVQQAGNILNSAPMQSILSNAGALIIWNLVQQHFGISGGQTLGAPPNLHPAWSQAPPVNDAWNLNFKKGFLKKLFK